MALTTAKTVERKADPYLNSSETYGCAASTTFFQGALVALNASGYLTKGAASTTLTAVGVIGPQPHLVPATSYVSTSNNGETKLLVQFGTFKFANSTTAACTIANIGDIVYIEDDETISSTAQTATLSAAGVMIGLDADGGVWVRVGAPNVI